MKPIKTALSLLLILTMLVSAVITASAGAATPDEPAPQASGVLGDTDGDSAVTIIDATAIQLWLAQLRELSDAQLTQADADLDGACTITDATIIQRMLAGIPDTYYLGLTVDEAKEQKASDDAQNTAQQAADLAQQQADQEEQQRRDIEYRIIHYQQTKGVDISVFNGNVDMKKLKAQGYSFVMIRMGYGSDQKDQDDTKFEQNVKNAEAAGLDWGAYLYSYALNLNEAKSEVKHTLRLLKGKKPTMPIAFDLEYDSYKAKYGMPSDKMLHDITLTYLSGIREAGYYPILYCGCSWLKGALYGKDLTGTYDIWLAQWYTQMDYYADNVGMWQYGGETNYIESPYISGLSGAFDKDYCFKNYPLIITAYGYNNHQAILSRKDAVEQYVAATGSDKIVASTSAQSKSADDLGNTKLPPGYNGVMGDSLRGNR